MGGVHRRRHTPHAALAVLALVVAAAPAAGLAPAAWPPHAADGGSSGGVSDTPTETHQRIEKLCRDADPHGMLLEAAEAAGFAPAAHELVAVPAAGDLESSLLDLYAALDLPLGVHDRALLHTRVSDLDPRVQAPVAILTAALAEAAALNARALADLTPADATALDRARTAEVYDADALAAAAHIRTSFQVAAAVLLVDAIAEARPLIDAAVAAGAWPETPVVADPVGLVYVGGTGDDVDTRERILVVDPSGNDQYYGRVGGASPFPRLFPPPPQPQGPPVALAVDLAGDDAYAAPRGGRALGGGVYGVGILWDAAGNDSYAASSVTMGAAHQGVGLLVDEHGNDRYAASGSALGHSGVLALGLFLDAAGDDTYASGSSSLGYATGRPYGTSAPGGATGSFCDRDGADDYVTSSSAVAGLAYDDPLANAWFADIGGDPDAYSFRFHPYARNDAYWWRGSFGGRGHGLDAPT